MGLVKKNGLITLKAIINGMLIKHNYNPNKNSSFQVALVVKNPPANAGDSRGAVRSLGWEDPLEKEMETHSSIPAWRIPWTEEPGRIWSIGSQRVGHD